MTDEGVIIKRLLDRRDELKEKLVKVDKAIRAYQGVCEHDWVYQGHDHNDDWYQCSICGKSDWR